MTLTSRPYISAKPCSAGSLPPATGTRSSPRTCRIWTWKCEKLRLYRWCPQWHENQVKTQNFASPRVETQNFASLLGNRAAFKCR